MRSLPVSCGRPLDPEVGTFQHHKEAEGANAVRSVRGSPSIPLLGETKFGHALEKLGRLQGVDTTGVWEVT